MGGRIRILFDKVDLPPAWKITTALYHIGWGTENPRADYESSSPWDRDLKLHAGPGGRTAVAPGQRYHVSQGTGKCAGRRHHRGHNYYHVHLPREDPVSAGGGIRKEFGPRRAQRLRGNRASLAIRSALRRALTSTTQRAHLPAGTRPGAFPAEWEGRKRPDSPKGHALDHFAFNCDNLDATLGRLRKDGVTVIEEPQVRFHGAFKSAFIEGPDKVLIELVEGRARSE
jgi:catechol 2,3-dioxygenase-like lactoylglutathione lyase family enzyme